jgi:hypothetical protein
MRTGQFEIQIVNLAFAVNGQGYRRSLGASNQLGCLV